VICLSCLCVAPALAEVVCPVGQVDLVLGIVVEAVLETAEVEEVAPGIVAVADPGIAVEEVDLETVVVGLEIVLVVVGVVLETEVDLDPETVAVLEIVLVVEVVALETVVVPETAPVVVEVVPAVVDTVEDSPLVGLYFDL